jgi:hypothetical protein
LPAAEIHRLLIEAALQIETTKETSILLLELPESFRMFNNGNSGMAESGVSSISWHLQLVFASNLGLSLIRSSRASNAERLATFVRPSMSGTTTASDDHRIDSAVRTLWQLGAASPS